MVMKARHWILAVAGIALALPAPASAAQGDPEVIIYRFPGVMDSGGLASQGIATTFHCTNFSGVTENIRFVTRGVPTSGLSATSFSQSRTFRHLRHQHTKPRFTLTF
jgi:hypothetical protein